MAVHGNYYEILGVEPDTSLSQIKRAFRKKAKAFHPDVDRSGRDDAMMRLLIAAYEVLSNPERRRQYDLLNARDLNRYEFNYRDFLKNRRDDAGSLAKLIFFDLLHHHEAEALDLYDALVSGQDFRLEGVMDREDFMDCAFLLAEEYEKRGEYRKAFGLLTRIAEHELDRPYFKHFFREVVDRLRTLVCIKMPGEVGTEDLVDYLEQLVDYEFSPRDSAFFLKRIAELYADQGQNMTAVRYLQRGLALHSKLPGVKKLMERLQFPAAAQTG